MSLTAYQCAMNTANPKHVPSPCIKTCTLDLDDICVGCHRHISEITGWNSASNEQKLVILENCKERKSSRPSVNRWDGW